MADLLTNAKQIYIGQPGVTETTLNTVGAGNQWAVLKIIACNTNPSDKTFSLSYVKSGESASDSNRAYKEISVPGYTTYPIDEYEILNTGDFISAIQETATAITLHIMGTERAV